ncbi:MAG: putative aminoacrylate peracid reductase RutC [Paracidovorax wautersii]|uniref:Putative aminoacrylate peracid reductase RutC n=1 Tax=Paracidovorax wautersii TaxID=1177982 RepID=A0A7V8JR04_9BURK|nr:MAG: putative aminoacrylate peracid reductase RutC [Paracidovorax wautersii]
MADFQRLHVESRWSELAIHNGVVYLAGQVPDDPSEDIQGQTRQVLGMIDRLLAQANSARSRLLRVQIYLRNIEDIGAMNEVWDQWIGEVPGHAPPRATVEARLANPDYLIEVVATAAQID